MFCSNLQIPNVLDKIQLERLKGVVLTKITEIEASAFERNKLINFIYVPNVETVCENAFHDCYFLKKFYSSKLKYI
jgi:hypothetical protein